MVRDEPRNLGSTPIGPVPVEERTDPGRWRALVAAFLGWMLDGYDYTVLTLVLIEIQQEFSMSSAEAGALGTVTLLTRLVGGTIAGVAADRWGRTRPLMLSILWFSVFSFASGFSTSFSTLLLCRALFGLGMGGEWAAGMPLVMEHWPERLRGVVSGFVQGAFSWGFILAAAVMQFVYPRISHEPWGWRAMLWSGLVPALLVIWVRRSVPESPVWLATAGQPRSRGPSARRVRLTEIPIRSVLLLGAMMFAYQSLSFWYGTLVRLESRPVLPYVVALNAGGILGAAIWGMAAATRLKPTGTIALGSGLAVAGLPLFWMSSGLLGLLLGGLSMGLSVGGVIGVAPIYVANRFPAERRGLGGAIVYHSAAAIGALAPLVLGWLLDGGWALRDAMSLCVAGASLAAIALALLERTSARLAD